MKKIFSLVFSLAFFQLYASAQFNKGSIYIDGALNYINTDIKYDANVNNSKASTFIFSPSVGYFVINNLAVGICVEYQSLYDLSGSISDQNKLDGVLVNQKFKTITSKWTEMAPSLFVKYVYPVSDKLSFSLKAKYSHGFATNQISMTQDSINYNSDASVANETILLNRTQKPTAQTNRLGLSVELQYFITKNVGLLVNFDGFSYNSIPKFSTGYDYNGTNLIKSTESTTSFNINPTSWSVGVFVLLGGQGSQEMK